MFSPSHPRIAFVAGSGLSADNLTSLLSGGASHRRVAAEYVRVPSARRGSSLAAGMRHVVKRSPRSV